MQDRLPRPSVRDGAGGDDEVVEKDVLVSLAGPLGTVATEEGAEHELFDGEAVDIAKAKPSPVEGEPAVEPTLDAAVPLARSIHDDAMLDDVPGSGHEVALAAGVPGEILTEHGRLVGMVDVLNHLTACSPHHACAPAILPGGPIAAGVVIAAGEPGQLASLDEVEPLTKVDAIGEVKLIVAGRELHQPLGAAGIGAVSSLRIKDLECSSAVSVEAIDDAYAAFLDTVGPQDTWPIGIQRRLRVGTKGRLVEVHT